MDASRASSDSPTTWVRPFYSSFDGLRAIAMLSVFFMHYGQIVLPWQHNYPPLWAGVDLFFVISGFLITGILLDSREDLSFFRNFYGRRALRIFPLFYGFFLALLLLKPVFHFTADPYLATTILYFSNLCIKGCILGHHGNPTLIWVPFWHQHLMLGNLWSLCVEEQFYLAWPLVVFLVRSRRTLLRVCVGGAVLVLGLRLRYFFHSTPEELATRFLYYSTWTRCDALLIGSGLAVWLREVEISRATLHRIASWLVAGSIGAILIGFALFGRHWYCNEVNPVFTTYGYSANALCAAGVLLFALEEHSWLVRVLRTRWLASLGRISYGLYFYHGLPFNAMRHYTDRYLRPYHAQWLMPPMAFAATWIVATLSFRYLESPFLRLKSHFKPKLAAGGLDPAPAEAHSKANTLAAA